MAKQKEGVYERIIDCAKKEFLEKGFKDASLRTIAKHAETSTSSIYTRFKDKEGLFDAIVHPMMAEFEKYFVDKQELFHEIEASRQDDMKYDYAGDCMDEMVDYIYAHYDEFRILLCCSYGTEAADFIERLIDIEVDYTIKFIEATGNDAIEKGRANRTFLHIVTKGYYSAFFEIVLHDMKKEDAVLYVRQLRDFYNAGHETIYHPEKIEF